MSATAEPVMKVTEEEMKAARLPVKNRGYCAHLLIPLNKCRGDTGYWMTKCTDERHAYEKCEYEEWLRLVEKKADAKYQ